MSELKNYEQSKAVFDALCQYLDKHELNYKKDEKKLSVECGIQGDDLPIDLTIAVDAERLLVMLISHIPFIIQEDKRLDVAIAVSAINNSLVDGCFDYDVAAGHMFFRMTNSFIESKIGEEVFEYMFICSCQIIDGFNDKFLMLSKGMISLEQFISTLENK